MAPSPISPTSSTPGPAGGQRHACRARAVSAARPEGPRRVCCWRRWTRATGVRSSPTRLRWAVFDLGDVVVATVLAREGDGDDPPRPRRRRPGRGPGAREAPAPPCAPRRPTRGRRAIASATRPSSPPRRRGGARQAPLHGQCWRTCLPAGSSAPPSRCTWVPEPPAAARGDRPRIRPCTRRPSRPEETAARARGPRAVARGGGGTTVARTLETAAAEDGGVRGRRADSPVRVREGFRGGRAALASTCRSACSSWCAPSPVAPRCSPPTGRRGRGLSLLLLWRRHADRTAR
jgi:hypothetical protein